MDPLLLRAMADHLDAGEDVVLLTVLERQGSAPATPGQKLVVTEKGQAGTIGGGNLEWQALEEARARLGQDLAPQFWHARLGPDLGMCCGGSARILIESFPAARRVWLVGAGHVSAALAPQLQSLGFRVHVSDGRDAWLGNPSFDACVRHQFEADELPFQPSARDVALVMTHDHRLDEEALEVALAQPFGLIGGVGSRAKAARIKARLQQKGWAEAELARIEMPVGVAIGARSPREIAVSIAARLVAFRGGPRAVAAAEVTV